MKYWILTFFISLAMSSNAQSSAIEGIKNNFDKQAICWNSADLECYMQAYATSEEIQTISRAGVTKGYNTILEQYKTYFPKDRMGKLHFDNMEFRRLNGKYYYVVGRFNLTYEDQQDIRQGYFSVLMKKIKGNWLIVSDHSS